MRRSRLAKTDRGILDRAALELAEVAQSAVARPVAVAVQRTVRARREPAALITEIEHLHRDLDRMSAVVADCAERLRTVENEEATSQPGGGAWWGIRTRRLLAALESAEPTAVDLWVHTWMEGVERGDWARAAEMVELGRGRFSGTVSTALTTITGALETSEPARALEPVEELVALGVGGPETQVRLGLLRVRILVSEFSDRERVREAATAAEASAMQPRTTQPGTTRQSLALAALAEVQLANGTIDAARSTVQRAISVSEASTDALILRGEVDERDGSWAAADRAYDAALANDPLAVSPVLLRRVPARLLARAAGRPGIDPAQAVKLLERALALGVPGDGDHPDKDVWVAKGDRLCERAADEDAARAEATRTEAAEAYAEAGVRYTASEYLPRAIELFGRACELDPRQPRHQWQHAAAMAQAAYLPEGLVDYPLLRQARETLRAGLRLRDPVPGETWVWVTQSAIIEELDEADADAALPLERALLLDPEDTGCHLYLASTLRRQGFPAEASEVLHEVTTRRRDPFAYRLRLALCLDRGDGPDALTLLDEGAQSQQDHAELTVQRAMLLLREGDTDGALACVEGDDTEWGRLTRALTLATLGLADPARRTQARAEFRSLWLETMSTTSRAVAGWAAFGAGLTEQGIDRYRTLAAGAPADLPYRRDLGQMLLVAGSVGEGASELEQGVAACPYPHELRTLVRVELPLVRAAVAGRGHAEDVERVLHLVERQASSLAEELGRRRRDPALLAARAAAARRARTRGEAMTALRRYRDLLGCPDLPEAAAGVALAGAAAISDADDAFARGEQDSAHRQWAEVESVASVSGCAEVVDSLRARRLLSDLMRGCEWRADSWPGDETDPEDPGIVTAVRHAAHALVRDPELLWALHDGLSRLLDRDDVSAAVARVAGVLLSDLPLSQAYGLDSAQEGTYPTFLTVRQLGMHLGADLAQALGTVEIDATIRSLQARLRRDLGVRIPWVYHDARDTLAGDRVDFEVYGRRVRSVRLGDNRTGWGEGLAAELERTLRGHAFRLVGVDDVALWLEGWDLQNRDAPDWRPTDPVVDRLRLARLIRMLLREGTSVADRDLVLAGLEAATDADRRGDCASVDTLTSVRGLLDRRALGVVPDAVVVRLPADLEKRLRAGLGDTQSVWELGRGAASELVADLRRWLDGHRPRVDVVVVGDPRLRLFAWRLLANRRLVVLAEQELGDE